MDLELDFWKPSRLNALVGCLKERMAASGPTEASGAPALRLPAVEDEGFWSQAADLCDVEGVVDDVDVGRALAECVHAELEARPVHRVGPGLWLGDLAAAESRLLVLTLGLEGVLAVASQSVDALWSSDGVAYHTAVVSPERPLQGQLDGCCGFLERHRPALVCCSSGEELSALVCAAQVAASEGLPASEALARLPPSVGLGQGEASGLGAVARGWVANGMWCPAPWMYTRRGPGGPGGLLPGPSRGWRPLLPRGHPWRQRQARNGGRRGHPRHAPARQPRRAPGRRCDPGACRGWPAHAKRRQLTPWLPGT